jgi:hypothetical protein
MFVNTHAFDVAEVTNFERLEQELVTEESPIKYYLLGRSFKLTDSGNVLACVLMLCSLRTLLCGSRISTCPRENFARSEHIFELANILM